MKKTVFKKLLSFLLIFSWLLMPEYAYAKDNKLGNSSGNIFNKGIAAIQGDWIYYRNDAMLGNLYKIKTNGTGKKQLNDDDVTYINVVGDWVYYLHKELDTTLYNMYDKPYKISINGKNRKMIADEEMDMMQVQGDWIYYVHFGSLYKMKTDGTKITDLKVKCDGVFIENDWIVYYDLEGYMYKMKADGTRKSKLGTCGFSINFVNKVVYYDRPTQYDFFTYTYWPSTFKKLSVDNSIRPVDLNGDDEDSGFSMNVYNGWIYYINASQDYNIYKIRTDGTDKTLVYDCNADNMRFGLSIVGDWIYYIDSYDEQCRVRTNGEDYELVEPY